MLVNSRGGSDTTTASDMVTAYASAPAPSEMAPGPSTVGVEAEPEADRCAPSVNPVMVFTPLHAETLTPPSVKGWEKVACTASTISPGFGSGKPWTLVATYVAMLTLPDETCSTSVYVLPTGVKKASVSTSVTD